MRDWGAPNRGTAAASPEVLGSLKKFVSHALGNGHTRSKWQARFLETNGRERPTLSHSLSLLCAMSNLHLGWYKVRDGARLCV